MFLPLAALLLIVSNIEMVARTTKKFAEEMIKQTAPEMVAEAEMTPLPEWSATEVPATPAALPQQKSLPKAPEVQSKSVPDSVIFEVVEVMPEFPGGQKGLMEYLGKNVKYPADAAAKGIQGRVITSFVVQKDGSISNVKIVRGVEPSLDKEAERVITTMPKWAPGRQRGEAVNVKYTVPIAFHLSKPEQPKAEEIKQSDLDEIIVVGYAKGDNTPDAVGIKANEDEPTFKVVEMMPKFPGGTAGLMNYLARSIKYPIVAQERKQQGKVIIQMIVGKDGSISNVKVLRSVTPALDAEAIRVVSTMPKWEPGQQGGQAVAVEYTLPIVFRLQ